MGNKKKRNKLCECGSGKLFRDCHMKGGALSESSTPMQSLAQQQVEHQIDTREAETMSEMMRAFEKNQQADHRRGDEVLSKLIHREVKSEKTFAALITLGAISLLPNNQAMEQRLLQLGQKVVVPSGITPVVAVDMKKICKGFDKHFGPSHEMAEIDTRQQIYISWVKFDGQYYRIFTGTLAEGEVYLQDIIWKYEAISEVLPDSLSWIKSLFQWAFKGVDAFIESSGLIRYESSNGTDYPNTNIHLDDRVNDLTDKLASSYIFSKDELSKEVSLGLGHISRKNTDFTSGGMMDFYETPVIDYGSYFVIPFPQLLIPAIAKWVFDQVPALENGQDIKTQFELSSKLRVGTILKYFFGKSGIIQDLTLAGKPWADYCVRYDGKLIFISIVTSLAGEDISDLATQSLKHMYNMHKKYKKDKTLTVRSGKGSLGGFEVDNANFEPIILTLVDNLSEGLMFGIGDIREDVLNDVIPLGGFAYIVHHSNSPLEFVRYLRAIGDLRNRKIFMPGATPLDLFAMYEEGNHQLREAEQDPNMLMVDLTAGARIITEGTRSKRKKSNLINVEGKKRYLHKHWDNFYGSIADGSMLLYRTDVTPGIKISVPLLRKEISEELRHSIYIVFDSLCYFLDQNHSALKEVLPTEIKNIYIKLEKKEDQKDAIKISALLDEQGTSCVTVGVNGKAHELFAGNNNDGERKVIKLFADAEGVSNSQAWLDEVIPESTERNFQTNVFSLSHKSYEKAPRPTSIQEGDRWWVDEVLSEAILAEGIQPGSYTDPKQIGDLATRLALISKQKLLERLVKFPRQQIIERSYKELEAVYAWDERKDYETLASIAIRDHDKMIEKHVQHNQDSTQLSFAYRYLIEASLQAEVEGDELLTDEAYLEILALAERYVDIEFWGDITYLDLQPGRLYISKRGYPGIESTGNGRLLSKKRAVAGLKSVKMRSELRNKILKGEAPKPGGKEKAMYAALNDPFKNEFGYNLEEFIDTGKAIIDLFANLDSPIIMIPKKVLGDKLSSDTGVDKDAVVKIIERLTLSQENLHGIDINPSQRFWRDERLLNKPLVAMPLNENILLFTRGVIERTMLSFLDRLMSGRLDYLKNNQKSELYKTVMKIVNEDASTFEDVVCDAVEEKGLVVRRRRKSVGGVSLPKEGVGEIDGLGWSAKRKTVYVLEIKDNDPARSPIEIKTELDNFYGRGKKKGYYNQLGDKYNWIKDHADLLRKEFDIDAKTTFKIKPILVSNAIVASSILKTAPHPTFTLDEFIETL